MAEEIRLALASKPTAVRQMRNLAAELATTAGLPDATIDDVRLAVSEAVTNSIRHGSVADAEIVMEVTFEPGRVTISISDRGPEAGTEVTHGLGLGLPIMTAVADDLQFEQAPSGSVVTMTFCSPQDA